MYLSVIGVCDGRFDRLPHHRTGLPEAQTPAIDGRCRSAVAHLLPGRRQTPALPSHTCVVFPDRGGTAKSRTAEQTGMVALDSEDVLERGDRAPSFELPGTDGDTHALSGFAGYKGVLVVFTCNHCPYAKAKFDELNRLTHEYDELAVVGINPNDAEAYPEDDFETMRERVADGTIAFDAYLRDESQEVATAYGARCTPDPFLLENTDREDSSLEADECEGDGPFHLLYHGRLDDAPNPDEKPERREMKAHVDAMLAGDDVTDEFRPSRGCSIKWRPGNEPDS